MDRDPDSLVYEPNSEDERIEPLETDDDALPPPPTLDPGERIEQDADDDAPGFDDDRLA
ncbi:hypothetical protein [Pseudolysinimonas sp.]|uniref:hypothetical protein n=1 Tax=Pseudolysinimonas sp. TaxID=2680009 RepID=UPI00286ABC28|nr:hypothetical protein [Pseudolysinimonas sp.]